MKEIDLDKSVFDLTESYPELIAVLKEMGFAGVANPIARNTLGRATTLRKGSERQGKDLKEVIKILEGHGFTVKQ
jgi:hypothetical protein